MSKILVGVQFDNSDYNGEIDWGRKLYHYYAFEDIEVGDLVVVKVSETFKVVRVGMVGRPEESDKANNYIIQKIDLDAYEKQQELIARKEALESEYNHLVGLESELRELQEVIKTTDSPRLKELSQLKIEEIKKALR